MWTSLKYADLVFFRWWVVCHANSVPKSNVSANVLQACSEEVQKIRAVLRFALGALFDYVYTPMNYDSLLVIDKYMLHLLHNFHNEVSIHTYLLLFLDFLIKYYYS